MRWRAMSHSSIPKMGRLATDRSHFQPDHPESPQRRTVNNGDRARHHQSQQAPSIRVREISETAEAIHNISGDRRS